MLIQRVCSNPGIVRVFHWTGSKALNHVPGVSSLTLFHGRQTIDSTSYHISQHMGDTKWKEHGQLSMEGSIWQEY